MTVGYRLSSSPTATGATRPTAPHPTSRALQVSGHNRQTRGVNVPAVGRLVAGVASALVVGNARSMAGAVVLVLAGRVGAARPAPAAVAHALAAHARPVETETAARQRQRELQHQAPSTRCASRSRVHHTHRHTQARVGTCTLGRRSPARRSWRRSNRPRSGRHPARTFRARGSHRGTRPPRRS